MTDLTVDGGEFSLFAQHNGVDFFEGSKQKVLSNIKCKCKDFNGHHKTMWSFLKGGEVD